MVLCGRGIPGGGGRGTHVCGFLYPAIIASWYPNPAEGGYPKVLCRGSGRTHTSENITFPHPSECGRQQYDIIYTETTRLDGAIKLSLYVLYDYRCG